MKKMVQRTVFLLGLSSMWLAAQPLQIYFEARPPYVVAKSQEELEGYVGKVVTDTLQKAGVEYNLKEMPAKRQLVAIELNKNRACGVGWFKNADREKFAQFTLPIYQDRATVIIRRTDDRRFDTIKSLDELIGQSSLTLLVKGGYSYGDFLDQKLLLASIAKKETFEDNQKMAKLIAFKRADFIFISYEEAQLLIDEEGKQALVIQEIAGLPLGNQRYLMCTQSVEKSLLEAINLQLSKDREE